MVYYPVTDPKETHKRGVVDIDTSSGRVLSLLEKPDPTTTASRFASPAIYAYRNSTVPLITQFATENQGQPLEVWGAPGKLLSWLLASFSGDTGRTCEIHGCEVSGRVDINSLSQYGCPALLFSLASFGSLAVLPPPLPLSVLPVQPSMHGFFVL